MIVKCLSLWQPYASLIAEGIKPEETRSWNTEYRGVVAIHAGLRDPTKVVRDGLRDRAEEVLGVGVEELPLGVIVCLSTITGVVPVETRTANEWGNFTQGRCAFVLSDVHKLTSPYKTRGWQMLFEVDIPEEYIPEFYRKKE